MREAMPAVAAPLLAAAWLSGCGGAPAANNSATAAAPLPKAPETPIEAAHRLVLARLAAGESISFADEQVYSSAGATVVCGRYQPDGQSPLRYIVVGDQDVFVEGAFEGDFGMAVTETCKGEGTR